MLLGRMLARLLAQLAESRRSTTDVGQSVAVHGLRPPLSSKKEKWNDRVVRRVVAG